MFARATKQTDDGLQKKQYEAFWFDVPAGYWENLYENMDMSLRFLSHDIKGLGLYPHQLSRIELNSE